MINSTAIAIRIYLDQYCTPKADIKMSDGVVKTIRWNDVKARKRFDSYITGYTLIYDDRPKRKWNEW